MSNLKIEAPLVNGIVMPFIEEGEACRRAVNLITYDDLRPPAESVNIIVKTNSGRIVKIVIPNDTSNATVLIDGEVI